MSLTLIEVMAAARIRRASLVAEIAGYLVLGAADQMAVAPRALGAGELILLEDGSIRVAGGTAASPMLAEQSLRLLLQGLLTVASSPTPALLRSGRRAPSGGVDTLPFFTTKRLLVVPSSSSPFGPTLIASDAPVRRALSSERMFGR